MVFMIKAWAIRDHKFGDRDRRSFFRNNYYFILVQGGDLKMSSLSKFLQIEVFMENQ